VNIWERQEELVTRKLIGVLTIAGLFAFTGCATTSRAGDNVNNDGGGNDNDAGPVGFCGDGVVEGAEECDDNNLLDGDGCDPSCVAEEGWVCTGEPSVCALLCDNGQLDPGEECEGEDLGGQTCTTIGGGYTGGTLACGGSCRFDTIGCVLASCGDGFVDALEACDDGNTSNSDGCMNNCQLATCGDGYLWSGTEVCDDGNASNADACLVSCEAATCGDGYLWSGSEACDDGNTSNTDACLNTCVVATCGDGYVRSGSEACDDGDTSNTDACLNTCVVASCGDGYVRSGVEDCESGMCCGGNCQFVSSTIQCRATSGECDVAEYCTGSSSSCPTNLHVADGTLCSIGDCDTGVCTPCVPGTGEFCSASNARTEYNCNCAEPTGPGWVDVGGDCWHRLTGYCNASNQWIQRSCGCGIPTTGTWVDQGGGCYDRVSGLSC
jgi:cysteine-rich repeat protein